MSRQSDLARSKRSKTSPSVGRHHPEFDRTIDSSVASEFGISQLIFPRLEKLPEPGILSVILYQGIGLSAPDQYRDAFDTQRRASVALSESRHLPWEGFSYQAHHKQCLPYAVLCFGHSRVFVGSVAGTTDSPAWAQEALIWNFDAVRASELSIRLYLKCPETTREYRDIPLGVVKVYPLFEEDESGSAAEWLDVQGGGTGKMRLRVKYTKNTLAQMGDLKETCCSDLCIKTVTALRKKETQQLYALRTLRTVQIGAEPTTSLSLRFQIDSPFIAPLMFACQAQSGLHLLSPLVAGEHLFYRLQRDRLFDNDRSRFYAAELLCALKHLHKLDIIYGGLGPKSILINSLGHITIVDHYLFLAAEETEVRAADSASWYPAPEVLLGQGHSKSSDWWTFGYILYEMLTGMPPFYNEDSDQARRNISSGSLALPSSLLPTTRDILSKLLHHDPGQRLGVKGPSEIEVHPFFNGVDWDRLEKCEYEPAYKPRCVATRFKDRQPPPITQEMMVEMFKGFKYNRPETQIGNSTEVQDENVEMAKPVPIQYLSPKVVYPPTIADHPRPTTQPHATLDEDADWELVSEETPQLYMLRDSRTNTRRKIPSRRSFYTDSHLPMTLQEKKEEVLEWALKTDNIQAVHQLLDTDTRGLPMDLNIRFRPGRETPLELAAEHENMALVELFLHHGADPSFFGPVNVSTQAGAQVALHRVVKKRNQALALLLLPRTHNRVLRTRALGLAVDQGDVAMVTALLAAGGVQCDFELGDRPPPPPTSGGGCYFTDISYPEEFLPPLVRAIKAGSVPLVRLLLAHGADPDVGHHDLPSELGIGMYSFRLSCGRAAQLAMSLGHREILQLLLARGADIGIPQPIWKWHTCGMIPRKEYLEITSGLRRAVGEMEVVQP